MPLAESEVAARLVLLIQTYGASALRGALRSVRFDDIDCMIDSSPERLDDVSKSRTIVTLGSSGYNSVSDWVERSFNPLGRFANNMQSVNVQGRPPTNALTGMLIRARHPSTGQVAYYAAGPSELATIRAASYLIDNWRALAREYPRSMPFCVVLEADPTPGGTFTVVYRTPSPRPTQWQVFWGTSIGG